MGRRYFPSPNTLMLKAVNENHGTIEMPNEFAGRRGLGA